MWGCVMLMTSITPFRFASLTDTLLVSTVLAASGLPGTALTSAWGQTPKVTRLSSRSAPAKLMYTRLSLELTEIILPSG